MKKKMKSMIAMLLLVVMGVLSGCGGQKFDAGAYTKACLDAMYKAEFGKYTEMTKIKKEEAQKDYDDNVKTIMKDFESVGISDSLLDRYQEFFVELLKNTKYSIGEVKEDDNKNYTVDVEIEPIKIFEGVGEETMTQAKAYAEELVAANKTPTTEEINEKVFQILLDSLNAKMSNIQYGEKQVVTVSVTKSDENVYSISDSDYTKIDENMFDISSLKFE